MGQRQDSLYDQMVSVYRKAVEIGCYDAADWIEKRFFAKAGPYEDLKEKKSPAQGNER